LPFAPRFKLECVILDYNLSFYESRVFGWLSMMLPFVREV
jgi:hypothetical protein